MASAKEQAAEALKPLTEGSPFEAIPGLEEAVEDFGEGMKELKEALDKIPGVDSDELMQKLTEAAGDGGEIVQDLMKGELPSTLDILEAADEDTANKVKEAMAAVFGGKSEEGGKSGRGGRSGGARGGGKGRGGGGGKGGGGKGRGGRGGGGRSGGGGRRGGGKPRGAPGGGS